ncbi:Aste57867_16766 [Aphanomyces stellatus]|uniref:Aste57867_16766 protein n=1 Tax=Aphanomyces stellatus TaxID=120398 RepID=A0A485L826_9STRA|nr:hypothetical protein As57867_016709 [Aphanomyces stellatus]VFT93531.1 Aste57867_16766 [Aphanomyces stellatus]
MRRRSAASSSDNPAPVVGKLVGEAVDGSERITNVGNALIAKAPNDDAADKHEDDPSTPSITGPRQKLRQSLARFVYLIDSFISETKGQAILLVVLCVVMAFGFGPIVAAVDTVGYSNSVWRVWTYMTDTGTQNHAKTHPQMAVAFFLTLIGFFYFAVVVGFVVDSIREKMDQLKHGRTQVVEFNHSLILGWSDKSVPYIQEICNANESEGGGVVVVLAELDSELMALDIESNNLSLQGTRIVFRTGNPLLSADLNMVAAPTARSICVMSTDRDAGKSDANLLRIILAVNSLSELHGHVVADTSDIDNEPLLELVGGSILESLVSNDIMGRLLVMCSRSPGLAKVYDSLLGFSGNEFYFEEWPDCVGLPFGELAARFPDAIPLGVKDIKGKIHLAPPMLRPLAPGDALLVLAEDNDSYKPVTPLSIPQSNDATDKFASPPPILDPPAMPQKILICGWRRDIRDMLRLLNALSPPGTIVHLLNEVPADERNAMLRDDGLDVRALANITLVHTQGNPAVRRHVTQIQLHNFDAYMVVSDAARESDVLESDSHVLASVLMLRSVEIDQQKQRVQKLFGGGVAADLRARHQLTPCIAEMLDPRTQKTIEENPQIGHRSEFAQTNELTSRMLAMVSENRLVKHLLDELLSGRGASFDVVPATRYCQKDDHLSFYQLVKRAQVAGEIVCGYHEHKSLTPTVLNPTEKSVVRSWWHQMDLVILREGHRETKQMRAVCAAFWDALHRRECRNAVHSFVDEGGSKEGDETNPAADDGDGSGGWAGGHHRGGIRRRQALTKAESHKKLFHQSVHARIADLWAMTDDVEEVIARIDRL